VGGRRGGRRSPTCSPSGAGLPSACACGDADPTRLSPGGGSGDEPYSLPSDVEFVFVLEGKLRVRLRDEDIFLESGDALTFPPRTEHTFGSVRPDGPTRVLWVFSPALSVEGLVQD